MQRILRVAVSSLLGVAMLAGTQSAYALTDGQLVKAPEHPAVYQVEGDVLRPFLHSRVFHTYYDSFDAVVEEDLTGIPVGDAMPVKGGNVMVMFPSSEKVYQLDAAQVLHHIPDEATATALFGKNWTASVISLMTEDMSSYQEGEMLEAQEAPVEDTVTDTVTNTTEEGTATENTVEDTTTGTTTDTTDSVVQDSETSITVTYANAVSELANIDFKNVRSGEGVYQGTFPAPAGTVLDKGYVGMDVYVAPTGDAAFTYTNKIWSKDVLICRDGVRNYFPSTGAAWDNAWLDGKDQSEADQALIIPVYNPVAPAGTALPDIWVDGYKKAYGKAGMWTDYTFVCSQALDSGLIEDEGYVADALEGFDNDGWVEYTDHPFTFGMYIPHTTPVTQNFGFGERMRLRVSEDTDNYAKITAGDNPETNIEAIDIVEYDADAYSRDSADAMADLKAVATQTAEARVLQTVAEPGSCKILDPRYKGWQQIQGGQYVSILPDTYNGKGYSVEEYTAGGKHGVALTYNKYCTGNNNDESYLEYERMYYFLTDADRLVQLTVEWANKTPLLSDEKIVEALTRVTASSTLESALLDQFVSKLGNNIR